MYPRSAVRIPETDCGLRAAGCGLRMADCYFSFLLTVTS